MKNRTHISTMLLLPSRTEDDLEPPMNGSFSCLFCLCLANSHTLPWPLSAHHSLYPFLVYFSTPACFSSARTFCTSSLTQRMFSQFVLLLRLCADAPATPHKKSLCCLTYHSQSSSPRRMVNALAFHDLSPLCAPGTWPAVESDWLFFWCPWSGTALGLQRISPCREESKSLFSKGNNEAVA